jgi:hypothetical protein
MMDGLTVPWWAPTTAPNSASSDMLVTTITKISGTTITLAAKAGTSVSSASMRFDNAPAITAAYNASYTHSSGGGGMLYIPAPVEGTSNACFVTSSYLNLQATVSQAGPLCLGATLQFSGDWNGSLTLNGIESGIVNNGFERHIGIAIQGAYPGIWRTGGSWRGTTILQFGNAFLSMLDTATGVSSGPLENNGFSGGSGGDYMGIHYYKWAAPGNGFGGKYVNNSFASALTQADGLTFTPFIVIKNDFEQNWDYFSLTRKGFWYMPYNNGIQCDFNMRQEEQGPIMPLVNFYFGVTGTVGGNCSIRNVILDTGTYSVIAATPVQNLAATIQMENIGALGGLIPLISGKPFIGGVSITGYGGSPQTYGQNTNITVIQNGIPGLRTTGIDIPEGPNPGNPPTNSDRVYMDSARHQLTCINSSGASCFPFLNASLTTTAATSDNVIVTGATASSHCQISPTNASAARNYSTTYISAKTTNQITVAHAATSGMTYDIACSPN